MAESLVHFETLSVARLLCGDLGAPRGRAVAPDGVVDAEALSGAFILIIRAENAAGVFFAAKAAPGDEGMVSRLAASADLALRWPAGGPPVLDPVPPACTALLLGLTG
jgi:hypothetical protein